MTSATILGSILVSVMARLHLAEKSGNRKPEQLNSLMQTAEDGCTLKRVCRKGVKYPGAAVQDNILDILVTPVVQTDHAVIRKRD